MEASRLSALVVVHNEASRLTACLAHLTFVDELVVILDRCTDGSRQIAEQFHAKIIEGAWPLEGPRRQAGLNACTMEWVLEVDADEHVPAELAALIRKTIAHTSFSYFPVAVDNYVGPHLIRYGWGAHFGTAQTVRLYRRQAKQWGHQSIHPQVIFHGLKGPCLLPGLQHYVDDNISDMIHRFDRYTEARARDLRQQGIPETLGKNIRRIFSRFFKCYVQRKGYKEGAYGFLIALLAGIYPLVSFIKATQEKPPEDV